jgi:hypothetical protein
LAAFSVPGGKVFREIIRRLACDQINIANIAAGFKSRWRIIEFRKRGAVAENHPPAEYAGLNQWTDPVKKCRAVVTRQKALLPQNRQKGFLKGRIR